MAIYEFYCPTCRSKFEERRPMSKAAGDATCQEGHRAERMLSSFAVAGASTAVMEMPEGGGCCGGACGCSN